MVRQQASLPALQPSVCLFTEEQICYKQVTGVVSGAGNRSGAEPGRIVVLLQA